MKKNYFESILGSEYEAIDSENPNHFLASDKQKIKHLRKKLKKLKKKKGKKARKKLKKRIRKLEKKQKILFDNPWQFSCQAYPAQNSVWWQSVLKNCAPQIIELLSGCLSNRKTDNVICLPPNDSRKK